MSGPDDAGVGREETDRPIGLSTPAWKGCGCSACRGERQRVLGRSELKKDQATLGGFDR